MELTLYGKAVASWSCAEVGVCLSFVDNTFSPGVCSGRSVGHLLSWVSKLNCWL